MTTNTATLTQQLAVSEAIDTFVEFANAQPNTPRHTWGVYTFAVDKPGAKFTRVVMGVMRDGALTDRSVHAFVDNTTGDLFKAAGWKAPAKGARYNLLTEMDVVKANFDWAGSYLYADHKRIG